MFRPVVVALLLIGCAPPILQASTDLAPLAVGLDDAHVVAVRETEVRVWSVEDELVYRLTSDTPLLAGTFPEAGVVLLEVEREDGSRLVAWDVAARKPRWSASVEVTGVGHAAHGPDGLAWVPAGEGDLQARDLRKGEVMGTVQAHEQPLQSVAYASRKLLAVAEDGASLRDTVYDNPVIEVPGWRSGTSSSSAPTGAWCTGSVAPSRHGARRTKPGAQPHGRGLVGAALAKDQPTGHPGLAWPGQRAHPVRARGLHPR